MVNAARAEPRSSSPRPLTVICVEDNCDLCRLLKFALNADQAIECTHTFEDGGELLELIESGAPPPDIVVTDWSMPDMSGREVVRIVRANWPTVRVIVYTAHTHPAIIDDACEAGAWGIVGKHGDLDVLISAIRKVNDGRTVIRC